MRTQSPSYFTLLVYVTQSQRLIVRAAAQELPLVGVYTTAPTVYRSSGDYGVEGNVDEGHNTARTMQSPTRYGSTTNLPTSQDQTDKQKQRTNVLFGFGQKRLEPETA